MILLSAAQPAALAIAVPNDNQPAAGIPPAADAGQVDAAPLAPTPETAEASSAKGRHSVTLPKLTPVVIRLVDGVGSNFSQPGQHFALEVERDVNAEGAVVIPAGTRGVGEVIHAKKSGGSGAGGELIVIADYLELDGRQIPLRSLQMSGTGGDRETETVALTMAVGVFGMLVKGRPIEFAPGFVGNAKLAADTAFEIAEPAPELAPGVAAEPAAAGAPAAPPPSDTNSGPAEGAGQGEPQGSVQKEGVST